MSIENPTLPYEKNALAPHISEQTLEYHYGKHHLGYVTKLNAAIEGTDWADKPLEDIIKGVLSGGIYNNAAQVWNHSFYWNSLSPNGGGAPKGAIADAIVESFGSFEEFQKQFTEKAATLFGSGWAWLVKKGDKLVITGTQNAGCPIIDPDVTPILTYDVWEHAYYLDYQNARPSYIAAFWNLVNWDFANKNLG